MLVVHYYICFLNILCSFFNENIKDETAATKILFLLEESENIKQDSFLGYD
ncbi:hypothetical protein [Clostridium tetani]|uniref:hypothetical protein n=1 Tax=Clostridium tetani TaxID=1513 RepID=UPI0013E93F3E|nr:hypothetical protein [Clostridium tetani]